MAFGRAARDFKWGCAAKKLPQRELGEGRADSESENVYQNAQKCNKKREGRDRGTKGPRDGGRRDQGTKGETALCPFVAWSLCPFRMVDPSDKLRAGIRPRMRYTPPPGIAGAFAGTIGRFVP